jgi:hypothetical protein
VGRALGAATDGARATVRAVAPSRHRDGRSNRVEGSTSGACTAVVPTALAGAYPVPGLILMRDDNEARALI